MIGVLHFFAAYNNSVLSKKKKNKARYTKNVGEILKLLVKLNIIS
jgi:hypothetical protein